VLAELRAWLDDKRGVIPPKTPMGAALGYLHRQWKRLVLFLEDGNIELTSRVGGRRGGVQACLGCVRRFQLRARLGLPSLRFRPPPHRTGQADFPHPAHREGVITSGL
jgi:hypothetical protein